VNHYLVIAHRTITSPDLVESLARLAAADPYSAFTLLVTATHPVWVEQNAYIEAQAAQRAAEGRRLLEAAGVYLARVVIGAGSPAVAAQDELLARPDTYDAIILHTPPPGLRDRVTPDLRRRIEELAGMPVFHAYRGAEEPWRGERVRRPGRLARLWQRTRFAEKPRADEEPGAPHAPTWREMLPIIGVMLLYLAGGLTLALTVNRGFLLNDVVALIVYSVVVGGLLFAMRHES
jgi:hypothetical protein